MRLMPVPGSAVLALCLSTAMGCNAAPSSRVEAANSPPASPAEPLPPVSNVPSDPYAIEKAMGAQCPPPDDIPDGWGPLVGGCRGPAPAHLMQLIRQIDPGVQWTERERGYRLADVQTYRAIPGFGERPDFMITWGSDWIRSFEGPDPDRTVYLVQAPFRIYDDAPLGSLWPEPKPAKDCGGSGARNRVFEVVGDAPPRDVTEDIMPPRPYMTPAEQLRYSPYMVRGDKACDSDIGLDMSKLQYAPVMRWTIMDFDPEKPFPKSDPRMQGDMYEAHFGFLVWNGTRFEMHERVPRSLWPCDPPLKKGGPECTDYVDVKNDPFIIEDQ
ncbi:MAG TPA: hypothetical protein VEY92_00580 [Pseudoxanthomonas sp.]|nr:hypothetical protein [Pseudoxanthomonas sp.]